MVQDGLLMQSVCHKWNSVQDDRGARQLTSQKTMFLLLLKVCEAHDTVAEEEAEMEPVERLQTCEDAERERFLSSGLNSSSDAKGENN